MAAEDAPTSPRLRQAATNLIHGMPDRTAHLTTTSPTHAARIFKERVEEAHSKDPEALERAKRRWRRDEYEYDADGNLVRADFGTVVAHLYSRASPAWYETFVLELARGARTAEIFEYLLLTTLAKQAEPRRAGASAG